MTVAWIGSRDAPVQHAVDHAAKLLAASRCPVISFETDIHGTRAAIELARAAGAAYDVCASEATARETAAFVSAGGFFVSPGEVRRRADLIVVIGRQPESARDFVASLAAVAPDLAEGGTRALFQLGGPSRFLSEDDLGVAAIPCDDSDLAGMVAALRARYLGRPIAWDETQIEPLVQALHQARFAAFLCSGVSCDSLMLEMLQGLVGEINRKRRASVLHVPASEAGWGSTLASGWTAGFPLRTGFAPGAAEYDPWRWDVRRMIEDGEADLHLRIASSVPDAPGQASGTELIVLAKTEAPVAKAAVTIPIGEPGVDHDAAIYSVRTGTISARRAQASSTLPPAATILTAILERLQSHESSSC